MARADESKKGNGGKIFGIDKGYFIAGIAVLAIMMFILEPFQWGSQTGRPSGSVIPSGKNVTGPALFNGSIRTYDPLLFIPLDTNQTILDQLRMNESVLDIQQQANSYMVQTQTRDDVFPLAAWLRAKNVTGFSIANVAANSQIVVETTAGLQNATVPAGVVRVVTEPILDADSEVTVSLVAVIQNGMLIDYSSASLVLENVNIMLDTTVASLDGSVYRYSIPWGERNSVGDLSGYGNGTEYRKVDSMVFTTPLTVNQIMIKKQFPYVVYIDSNSAQVESSFSNVTQLQENFADTPFTLPDSSLTIASVEPPELNYTPSVTYRYTLVPLETAYDFGQDPIVVEGATRYDVNSTVQLNISALALGNRILSIKRVSLPS